MLSKTKLQDNSSSKSTKSQEKADSLPAQSWTSQNKKKKILMKETPVVKNQCRITKYFPLHTQTPAKDMPSPKRETQVTLLQSEIVSKNEELIKIRTQKQVFQNRYSILHMENRNYKAKSQELMINLLREDAMRRREMRKEVKNELGCFKPTQRGGLKFELGSEMKKLSEIIDEKKAEIQKFTKDIGTYKSQDKKNRIILHLKFIREQLQNKEKQKRQKLIILEQYKANLRLSIKEADCFYAAQQWPIVMDSKGKQRYLTLELVGQGGFGEVYKCFDLEDVEHVAIKINQLKASHHQNEQEQQNYFLKHVKRQVKTHISLKHPNIAKIKQILQISQDKIIFVLEYCDGPQLSLYLKKYLCLEEKVAKNIVHQLFSALLYLSQLDKKVIHYDLKPSNIMFHKGAVKILDFGLCKLMNFEDSHMELTSQGVGTYWYLPPQTFKMDHQPLITSKVDIWSVGVIFYELIFGRKPFANNESQDKIIKQDLITKQASHISFPETNPNGYKVSEQAKQFITQCLKYDPEERLSAHEAYYHQYFVS